MHKMLKFNNVMFSLLVLLAGSLKTKVSTGIEPSLPARISFMPHLPSSQRGGEIGFSIRSG
jgi:hypothetical protein